MIIVGIIERMLLCLILAMLLRFVSIAVGMEHSAPVPFTPFDLLSWGVLGYGAYRCGSVWYHRPTYIVYGGVGVILWLLLGMTSFSLEDVTQSIRQGRSRGLFALWMSVLVTVWAACVLLGQVDQASPDVPDNDEDAD